MSKNIIEVFARGDRELFHSAVLAWLMDEHESHGLGKSFRARILSQIGSGYDPNAEYKVTTEHVSGRSRFDILLEPMDGEGQQGKGGLVFENKFKAEGHVPQPEKYQERGYDVVFIALLPETLPEKIKRKYRVIGYDVISNALKELPLRASDHYQFLVDQYRHFIDTTLAPFSLIAEYSKGGVAPDNFIERLGRATQGISFRDNDIRTFTNFYYSLLVEYLKTFAPDLVFGTAPGTQKEVNTEWYSDKDQQGAPFLETLIRRPFDTPSWTLHPQLRPVHETKDPTIAPRLEIWLNPSTIVDKGDIRRSWLMLGTWSPELLAKIKQTEPYCTILKPRARATRNFGCEEVHLRDLPFPSMVQRIRKMIGFIFDTKGASLFVDRSLNKPIENVSPTSPSSKNLESERVTQLGLSN